MSKRPPLTDRQKEQIAEMRSRNVSMGTIARLIGCHRGTVSWRCLIEGIEAPKLARLRPELYLRHPVTKRGNGVVRAFTPEEDARLVALDRDGLNYSDIGRALERPRNSVQARLTTLARREERAAAMSTNHHHSLERTP